MRRSGAEILTTLLERQGVGWVAGIPGGACLPIYDALHSSTIRHVLARHEQGAGFIAQGMARVTGRAAVCLATSGPGVTNLVTAIADARMDSVPLVAVTGQVPTSMIGTDAFQEVDTYGLAAPITKHVFLVRDAAELLEAVPLAFEIAESGRMGPVLLDVPKNVQQETVDIAGWPEPGRARPAPAPRAGDVRRIADMIAAARRPVLYAGGGVIAANAAAELAELARRNRIPVTLTLSGLGAFPADDPLFLGMLGMHGASYTNRVLEEADLLLALGVRFDDRATGKATEFCPNAVIAHVDVDAAEIDKIKPANAGIVADAGELLRALVPFVEPRERTGWFARVEELRRRHPLAIPNGRPLIPGARPVRPSIRGPRAVLASLRSSDDPRAPAPSAAHVRARLRFAACALPIPPDPVARRGTRPRRLHFRPLDLVRRLGERLSPDTIVTTDVGQHQMWVAQAYPFRRPRTLLTSGGLGTMGFGLPAAIGAALASPGTRVVCVTGDGSLLMNVQELATLAELALPVAVLVLDNRHLGLVRQQQELFYGRRFCASRFDGASDFAAIGAAFGIPSVDLELEAEPLAALDAALGAPGPCLVRVPIPEQENVLPMVPPGAANRDMIEGDPHGLP